MTINPAFEEDKQNDGEHIYADPNMVKSRYSKVRPYFVIYLSCLSKINSTFRIQVSNKV